MAPRCTSHTVAGRRCKKAACADTAHCWLHSTHPEPLTELPPPNSLTIEYETRDCGHPCYLDQGLCCACADKRPHNQTYWHYGNLLPYPVCRSYHYCPCCRSDHIAPPIERLTILQKIMDDLRALTREELKYVLLNA